jgi:archaellum component FlaG (FlaF/FlaG flagellin family)
MGANSPVRRGVVSDGSLFMDRSEVKKGSSEVAVLIRDIGNEQGKFRSSEVAVLIRDIGNEQGKFRSSEVAVLINARAHKRKDVTRTHKN